MNEHVEATSEDCTKAEPQIPDGFMEDAKGRLVPLKVVKPVDLLMDQTVRVIFEYAEALSAQLARFKVHTNGDIDAFQETVRENYGADKGGAKGNVTLTSYDGRLQIKIAVADHLQFGPELQAAKALVDECIAEWAEGANENIQALVAHAFRTDKAGKINVESVLSLRRLNVKHERWQRAMQALSDSIRVVESKQYIRIYRRPSPTEKFAQVPLDLAGV